MQDWNNINDDLSQQGLDTAKEIGKTVTRPVTNGLKRGVRKYGGKAVRATGKGLVKVGKSLVQAIVKLMLFLGPVGIGILLTIVFLAGTFVFLLDERGSNESNDLDPDVQNPTYIEDTSGISKAIAMTEPQAVIDAYYKYLSCSSYSKTHDGKVFEFNDPDQTSDFAGLRDYNKIEDNFYLSDDFIRCLDEMLHQDEFYYPEQIIKPVFGQQIELKDKKGNTDTFYTSRIPYDTPDGETMLDSEQVKNFDEMLADGVTLDAEGAMGDDKQLIAQSQKATEKEMSEGEVLEKYEIVDRDVIFDDNIETEAGLWDYGFGSVLQYQPEEKRSYIECHYDKVDVDFDYERYEIVGYKDGKAIYGWTGPYHGFVSSVSTAGGLNSVKERCASICSNKSLSDVRYSYNLPTNIEAIVDDNTAWKTSAEPNAAVESNYYKLYGRSFVNSHIDTKISDAWDSEIDKTQFKDETLKNDYGNVGGGLYPIKIAIASHAATFSGNIHYSITPAGEEGCIEEITELSPNTKAVIDQREPVQTVQVAGGCAKATLTAHRTGNLITQMPAVEETPSPWGFGYLETFAEFYTGYVPQDYKEDRDFFIRTGLNPNSDESKKKEYRQNLSFLQDLGLLRLYTGNTQYSATGSVDLAAMEDSQSDLYILSHVIAAEAGPNKLDELLVGSVFVNRVQSKQFPNTFMEVLTQSGQYACYTDGNYQKANPTEREIASAIQVLTGQFSIPENILGQSAYIQGTIYKMVDNPAGLNDHYYCTMKDEAISTVDRFGRPALQSSALEAAAAALENASYTDATAASTSIDYSSTAFIGDSLTMGLDNAYSLSDKGATVIASAGSSITTTEQACINNNQLNRNIRTVYLLIGTNSCGLDDDIFKNQYLSLLSTIEEKTTGARIILTSLPPVVDGQGSATNTAINAKNAIIAKIAADRNYKILDIHSSLVKDGKLNPTYSEDGLHLTRAGYSVWFSKIQSGLTFSAIGADPSTSFTYVDAAGQPISSEYTLYEIADFDVLTATYLQARLKQPDSGLLAALQGILASVGEAISDFFNSMKEIFTPSKGDSFYRFAYPYNNYDAKSVVYHSIAFSNQVWFSTAETQADSVAKGDDGLMFLFVGKNSMLGLSSLTSSTIYLVPGVGTTVDGMISPTNSYYKPLTDYSSANGYMELSTPASTNVLAVADGKITAIGNDPADTRGRYVTMEATIDGDTYEITYGYLNSISVAAGKTVKQGDLIGTTGARADGTAALYLSVRKNGQTVDPSGIFYQMSYTTAPGLAGNLNNPDGTVNEELIAELEKELTAYVNSGGGKYHKVPLNTLQYKQCTWWAFGRGFQYVESLGLSITVTEYRNAIHGNGGQYADNNAAAGLFRYGTEPKPNSIVCYPGSPGHVAYVEAVDYVNRVYYQSEAGSGKWWGGINKKAFGSTASGSGGRYGQGVFIYLDEPLK